MFGLVILVVAGFVGGVAMVPDVLIDVVGDPVLELGRLVFQVLGVDGRNILECNESVLVCISDHAAITLVEDLSFSLALKLRWRVNV